MDRLQRTSRQLDARHLGLKRLQSVAVRSARSQVDCRAVLLACRVTGCASIMRSIDSTQTRMVRRPRRTASRSPAAMQRRTVSRD
jgi:hypothetical protein